MATQHSSASFPHHPTAASTTSNRLPKAPIYNPYDKFTQNEFDLWIGDITGALRRALGQEGDEEEQESMTPEHASDFFVPPNNAKTARTPEYQPEEQSEAEQSEAEMKIRRDKGKGRDPREGPGLGQRLQPIEIVYSDSDEEGDDGDGEEEVEVDEIDEEGEYDWREYDSDGNRYNEDEGSENGYSEVSGHRVQDDSTEEIIELSSGNEEEEEEETGPVEDEDEDAYEEADRRNSADANARYTLSLANFGEPPSPPDEDEDTIGEDEQEYPRGEDQQTFPPRRSPSQPLDLVDPWIGPQTYAQDFYSGGDILEGVLNPALVSPSNLTPVRASSEHTWEQDANGLLPQTPAGAHKEPVIIDVDLDEDEKDEDLLPESSPLASSPVEEYVTREGEYDENYEFRDDKAFDEFLKDDGRPREIDSRTPSPEIFIAAQPHLDHTPTNIPEAPYLYSYPLAQGPNEHFDFNFRDVTSSSGHIVTPPINSVPEIIELVDDDGEEDADYDDNNEGGRDIAAEVEEIDELRPDEKQVQRSIDNSCSIGDILPEAMEEDIRISEAVDGGSNHRDRAAIAESFVARSCLVDDNSEELVGTTHSTDAEISTDQANAVHEVTIDPEATFVDGTGDSIVEDMHEVPADVRFKASLLESFLANADSMVRPVWNGKVSSEVNLEQPPVDKIAAMEDNTFVGSLVSSTIQTLSEDNTEIFTEPLIESFAAEDAANSEPVELSYGGPDELHEAYQLHQAITAGAPGKQTMYYAVDEVMTDDGRCSTVPPNESDIDVTSATEHSGELVPYIVDEPESEGMEPEEPTDGTKEDATAHTSWPSDKDKSSFLATAEHTPKPAFAETLQPELVHHLDLRCNHQTLADVMPTAASVHNTLAAEPLQSDEIAVPAQVPSEEEREKISYAFSMPISANPSVPEPAGMSGTSHARSNSSASMQVEGPYDSAPDLDVSPKGSVETPSLFPLSSSMRQVSSSNTSTSDLFTPRSEAFTVPGSPNPQSAEPDAVEGGRLTPAESERSTRAISVTSFLPVETMNTTDVSGDGALDGNTRAISIHLDDASFVSVPPSEVAKPLGAVEDEDDPFKLMGNDSKVAPGAVNDGESSGEREDNSTGDIHRLSPEIYDGELPSNHVIVNKQVNEAQEATVTTASFYQNGASLPFNGSAWTDIHGSAERQKSKPLKRKRTFPPSIPVRLTRSMSAKNQDIDYKGKAKAEDDAASENGSSSSGASAASRMLRIPSRDTSRASSVVSTTQSVESSTFSVHQSPTLGRQASGMAEHSLPPVFYHVHSGLLHHHSRPSTDSRPSQIQKNPVPSSQSKDISVQSNTPQASPSQRTAAVMHSPVTRSNCRFRRISLPREEGGPRVSFIVPGCSLGNRTLMDEEGIQDEGDATTLDHARMVGDIETLDFSSELVGVLRQLVGVDLLRENEIFHLPQPGESYRRIRHGKSKIYAARPTSGDLAASLGLQSMSNSPRGPTTPKISPKPSLVQAPVSAVGSASTSTGSTGWNDREYNRYSPSISYSDDEGVKPDESEVSQMKRRKGVAAKRNGAASEEMPPPSSAVQSKNILSKRGPKTKRSKRLSIDAHAYKPELEAEETSTDHDSETTKGRRRNTGKRGIKRNRTSEIIGQDGGPQQPMAKRLRARLSTSSNGGR